MSPIVANSCASLLQMDEILDVRMQEAGFRFESSVQYELKDSP